MRLLTAFLCCLYLICCSCILSSARDTDAGSNEKQSTSTCTLKEKLIISGVGAVAGAGAVFGGFAAVGLGAAGPVAGALFAANMGAAIPAGGMMAGLQAAAMGNAVYGVGAAVVAVGAAAEACDIKEYADYAFNFASGSFSSAKSYFQGWKRSEEKESNEN
jgi:hypothetical protein